MITAALLAVLLPYAAAVFTAAYGHTLALLGNPPTGRFDRIVRHCECIMVEPWHALRRSLFHWAGIIRELRNQ